LKPFAEAQRLPPLLFSGTSQISELKMVQKEKKMVQTEVSMLVDGLVERKHQLAWEGIPYGKVPREGSSTTVPMAGYIEDLFCTALR
jgi:hypothetical protein